MIGLHAGVAMAAPEPIPDSLLSEELPPDSEETRHAALAQELYVALSRARSRLVLSFPRADDRGAPLVPLPALETVRAALGAEWQEREEELFGPAETLHSTYRLLRDELLEGTARAGGRLGELRFDTDLDVSHAVVRYLELLKLAALIARGGGRAAWPSRCATSTRGSSRRSPPSSARSSSPRRSTTTCSTPSATRAGAPRRSSPATSRRWSRSCPGAARA